ncbi:MAG: Ig-like domain-containing protein, partial [Burkholderiaceae bacterium]|nr:Ig-like domain-containing protein [Burkholderiaceae bacterium]
MAIAYFNVVYKGTGSSYTPNSSSIAITTRIDGRGFVYTQGAATTGDFIETSSNVLGTLSYIDEATGATVSISGNLTRKVSTGNTVEGFYFHDGNGSAYLMMVPAKETTVYAGGSVSTNSSPFIDDLNALVTLQATQPVISVSSPSESEGHGSVEFTVSLSHAANADISFAPELHNGTAKVADGDYAAGLEYWDGSAWAAVIGSVTIAKDALSVRLRAVVNEDLTSEPNETFTLQTGAITGGNVTNNGGAFGTATIVDNDQSIGLNATTNNGLVTVTITGLLATDVLTLKGTDGVLLEPAQYSATWNPGDSTWSVKLLDAQLGAGTTSDPFGTYFNGELTNNSDRTGDGTYTVLNNAVPLGGFTIDTMALAPMITDVTELAGDANTADLTTNDNTQVLTVTGETGGTIKVYTTAGTLVDPGRYVVTESTVGTYTVDFGTNVLADGSYTVKLTDAVGNVSAASSAFVIETSPYISGTDVTTVNQGQSVAISGFTIGDPDNSNVTVRIQAAHGTLSLVDSTGVGGYSGPSSTLVFNGSVADVNAALNTLSYLADANYSGTDPLVLEISDDGGTTWEPYTWRVTGKFYNPANGHYYEAVDLGEDSFFSDITMTWAQANNDALTRKLNGLDGYLATITSAAEQQFILDNIGNVAAWIGASDATTEGVWKWVTGPEAGTS